MDRPPPPPTAPPPDPLKLPRASQIVLAVMATLCLALLAYRGYGNSFAIRPTEQQPSASRHRVDLNTADKPELLQVPGIGPNLAEAILSHRRERGHFTAVEDVAGVKGIGGKTFDKLRPWLTVTPPDSREEPTVERLERKPIAPPVPAVRSAKMQPGDPPLDVNAADETALLRLPGIGPTLAQRILQARESGPFKTPDDLRKVKGIGVKTLEAIRPFVICR